MPPSTCRLPSIITGRKTPGSEAEATSTSRGLPVEWKSMRASSMLTVPASNGIDNCDEVVERQESLDQIDQAVGPVEMWVAAQHVPGALVARPAEDVVAPQPSPDRGQLLGRRDRGLVGDCRAVERAG